MCPNAQHISCSYLVSYCSCPCSHTCTGHAAVGFIEFPVGPLSLWFLVLIYVALCLCISITGIFSHTSKNNASPCREYFFETSQVDMEETMIQWKRHRQIFLLHPLFIGTACCVHDLLHQWRVLCLSVCPSKLSMQELVYTPIIETRPEHTSISSWVTRIRNLLWSCYYSKSVVLLLLFLAFRSVWRVSGAKK